MASVEGALMEVDAEEAAADEEECDAEDADDGAAIPLVFVCCACCACCVTCAACCAACALLASNCGSSVGSRNRHVGHEACSRNHGSRHGG